MKKPITILNSLSISETVRPCVSLFSNRSYVMFSLKLNTYQFNLFTLSCNRYPLDMNVDNLILESAGLSTQSVKNIESDVQFTEVVNLIMNCFKVKKIAKKMEKLMGVV